MLLISVLFWVLDDPAGQTSCPRTPAIVPDVTGMTYERANASSASRTCISFRVDETNAEVAVGNVIRTDPDAGASVDPGPGRARVRVDGSGDGDRADARRTGAGCRRRGAQAAGLVLGTITPRNDHGSGARAP